MRIRSHGGAEIAFYVDALDEPRLIDILAEGAAKCKLLYHYKQ